MTASTTSGARSSMPPVAISRTVAYAAGVGNTLCKSHRGGRARRTDGITERSRALLALTARRCAPVGASVPDSTCDSPPEDATAPAAAAWAALASLAARRARATGMKELKSVPVKAPQKHAVTTSCRLRRPRRRYSFFPVRGIPDGSNRLALLASTTSCRGSVKYSSAPPLRLSTRRLGSPIAMV